MPGVTGKRMMTRKRRAISRMRRRTSSFKSRTMSTPVMKTLIQTMNKMARATPSLLMLRAVSMVRKSLFRPCQRRKFRYTRCTHLDKLCAKEKDGKRRNDDPNIKTLIKLDANIICHDVTLQ